MRGNKNPPTEHLKETQWKPGQSGNPSGISSEALQARRVASEKSTILRAKAISAIERRIERLEAKAEGGGDEDEDALLAQLMETLVNSDVRGFLNDANDREDGKPTQAVKAAVDTTVTVQLVKFSGEEEGEE